MATSQTGRSVRDSNPVGVLHRVCYLVVGMALGPSPGPRGFASELPRADPSPLVEHRSATPFHGRSLKFSSLRQSKKPLKQSDPRQTSDEISRGFGYIKGWGLPRIGPFIWQTELKFGKDSHYAWKRIPV
jgi:hypothetical protein